MDKIRIGENEYQPPFWWDYTDEGWFIVDSLGSKEPDDGEGDQVEVHDILAALNELAQLRAERDALKARVEELGLAVKAYKEKHQGCHTMEFSPCATCDFIDAVQEWVDDTKNTTPGGDE